MCNELRRLLTRTRHAALAVAVGVLSQTAGVFAAPADGPEIVIYGGTPSGIAAAIAAGESGRRVLLVEPYSWVGGMTTNGLSHPDFRTFEGLTGFYLALTRQVRDEYLREYGADSAQVRDCFRGTHGEPHVYRRVLERMLAAVPSVGVRVKCRLKQASLSVDGSRIASATFSDAACGEFTLAPSVWIDATYEGDLLAAAGVPYRLGREARAEHGESLAPDQADRRLQGYNFRLSMTKVPANRVTPVAPPGYDREEFVGVLPLLASGRIEKVFGYTTPHIYKDQIPPLPNDKRDINDVSRSPARLSLPELAAGWPEADEAGRARIYAAHVRHNQGLLYFLQNDTAVPGKYRDEARGWGWCRDEFAENGHVPEQLYVREARRMVGEYVFTEGDTGRAEGDARTKLRRDAVAFGDYGLNCHGTGHDGPLFGGQHTGEFYRSTPPYQIPYGVMVPKGCRNLLVPVAVSASHVGFCGLRLEPIWSSLGVASGLAAAMSIETGSGVRDIAVPELQRRLHGRRAATIYVSDVPSDSVDFAAVQWWGGVGGLHGSSPAPAEVRGPKIIGQYYEAFPNHAAELDHDLDPETRSRWIALAADAGVTGEALTTAKTRGEFIRRAYGLVGR